MEKLQVQKLWEQSGGNNPLHGKTFQELLEKEDFSVLFSKADRYLYCIDEGAPRHGEPGGFFLAGSGILVDKSRILEWIRPLNLRHITSHEGCGACALYAQEHHLEGDPDIYGVKFSRWLANELGIEYAGQISKQEMDRPEGFHDARVIYYDGTGMFQEHRVQHLPKGFTISRGAFPEDAKLYMQKELALAISIALGNKGFGNRFTAKTPLYVCTIGSTTNPNLTAEKLAKKIAHVVEHHKDRVVIHTMTPKLLGSLELPYRNTID